MCVKVRNKYIEGTRIFKWFICWRIFLMWIISNICWWWKNTWNQTIYENPLLLDNWIYCLLHFTMCSQSGSLQSIVVIHYSKFTYSRYMMVKILKDVQTMLLLRLAYTLHADRKVFPERSKRYVQSAKSARRKLAGVSNSFSR